MKDKLIQIVLTIFVEYPLNWLVSFLYFIQNLQVYFTALYYSTRRIKYKSADMNLVISLENYKRNR